MLKEVGIKEALDIVPRDDYGEWNVNSPSKYPYNNSFEEVLKGKSLYSIVKDKRQILGKAFVLDLMGYGQILRDLPLNGGVATALGDPRNNTEIQIDVQKNIDFIEGNIVRRSTWIKMQNWLEKQEVDDKKFDLILCRAVRGLDKLTNNPKVHLIMLQRAWQMLSSNNGILLTQVQEHFIVRENAIIYTDFLNQQKGIKAEYSFVRNPLCEPIAYRPVLLLEKSSDAPMKLPV